MYREQLKITANLLHFKKKVNQICVDVYYDSAKGRPYDLNRLIIKRQCHAERGAGRTITFNDKGSVMFLYDTLGD